jgi:hypothetical protein
MAFDICLAQGFTCSIMLSYVRQLLELTAPPTPLFDVRQLLELWAKIDLDEQIRLHNIDGFERKNIAYWVVGFPLPSCCLPFLP